MLGPGPDAINSAVSCLSQMTLTQDRSVHVGTFPKLKTRVKGGPDLYHAHSSLLLRNNSKPMGGAGGGWGGETAVMISLKAACYSRP